MRTSAFIFHFGYCFKMCEVKLKSFRISGNIILPRNYSMNIIVIVLSILLYIFVYFKISVSKACTFVMRLGAHSES